MGTKRMTPPLFIFLLALADVSFLTETFFFHYLEPIIFARLCHLANVIVVKVRK